MTHRRKMDIQCDLFYNEDGQQQSPDINKGGKHYGCRTPAGKERILLHRPEL